MILDETSEYVYIFSDIVYLAIGTFRLDEAEVDAVLDRLSLVGAVPSGRRVGPFEELLSPSVEDVGMKFGDTLIAILGFVDVVDAIPVGRESIRHLENTLGNGDGERLFLVGTFYVFIAHGELGIEDDPDVARFSKVEFRILFIPYYIRLLGVVFI